MGDLTPCNWCAETARLKWDLTAQGGLYAAAKAITVGFEICRSGGVWVAPLDVGTPAEDASRSFSPFGALRCHHQRP